MKKIVSRLLGLVLLSGGSFANVAMSATGNDISLYINGQYYQCRANDSADDDFSGSCKNVIETYKTSWKTCEDNIGALSSFAEHCIRPLTKEFNANVRKDCIYEAKNTCLVLCLEHYKEASFVGYPQCKSYCAE